MKQVITFLIDTTTHNCHSEKFPRPSKSKPYKKVRLKCQSVDKHHFISYFYLTLLIVISCCVKNAWCNRPPKFLIEGQTEIVLRLKEGDETPVGSLIYKLKGFDPDGDTLSFGARHSFDSDILKIENSGNNEANIYLNKELDREIKDEYSIVLTLTDNRLGDGNFVTQSLLLLVEDINDNEPIFKPYQSALEVPENSRPGVVTTVEATDRDEGAYGQVVYYLQELEGDNDVFTIQTHHGKGIIRLVKNLDYETKSLYQLRVLAVDRANQGPVNTGTAAILVKVRDVEDTPPVFSAVNPVTRISEDAPIGTTILQIKAHDGDRGINNPIHYSILSGGNDLFAINEKTGVVFTRKTLDREDSRNQENGAYILEIQATEISKMKPPPSISTEITIILTDVNDETPTFHSSAYEAEIRENAQENTPITFLGDNKNWVFDFDQGNNGTFELFFDADDHIFEVTPKRAINEASFLIRVRDNRKLDYELIQQMNYTLIAREVVKDGKWSAVPIRIFIRDSNDNFPEFEEQYYEFGVLENSGVGTVLGKVHATDRDSENYGSDGIRYTHLGGSISNLLNLDPLTGVITVKSSGEHEFDRELISTHYLTVEARDNLGKGNRNTVQLILVIKDVNDNPPIFLESQYEAKLLENKMNFETPLIVKAKDADMAGTRNSDIVYEIIDGEFKMNFTINRKTGALSPLYPMDYEALKIPKEKSINIQPIGLTVVARDLGVPSMATKTSVVIYLHDVNDHVPQFKKDFYEIAIPENLPSGSFVLRVSAIDRDGSSPNNLVVYRIQSGAADKFVISADTGVISVAVGASLDPDLTVPKTLDYSLVVLALDGGLGDQQQMSATIVNITINDVNNKVPQFEEPKKIVLIENTPVGSFVYQLVAHDLDANPKLRYYLDPNVSEARSEEGVLIKSSEYDFVNAFELNPIDGTITVVKLIDREKVEQIKLGVAVEDTAAINDKQVATAFLTIIIEDENDNNPKFRKPFYKRSITENSPTGIAILNIAAYDIDKNRTIKYALEGPESIFNLVQIDTESGEIVVSGKIDHEVHQWLNYTVRAIDSGIPARSSLVDVFIRVIDENDNNPYFISDASTNLTVYENSPIGTRISMIQANDADSGDFGKITFLIDKMSSHGKFMIDADTGVLMVADEIDREEKSSYMVVIEVWDNYQFGYLSGESRNAFKQFFINILDENDSPPVLNIPKTVVSISEYHDLLDTILHIKAYDADDPLTLNGKVELSISAGSGRDYFNLIQSDPWNGDLFAKGSLQNYYGNYTLKIQAKDLGSPQNTVEETVFITVLDFNDHAPYFIAPTSNVTIRVPENATVGTSVIQVKAIDNDVGPNAAVLYRLKQDTVGNYRSFAIDQVSGIITVKQPLDRERQKIYDIRVEAYDQGIPPLSTDLDLTIYVRNVNDYEPQFLIDEIRVNFTEHTPPGIEKIKLPDTVDRDEVDELDDPPSVVCYFIVYGNSDEMFHLEPESHILTVLKELDREVMPNHTLIVKATENCTNKPNKITLPKSSPLSRSYHSALTRTNTQTKYLDWFNRYKHSRSLRSTSDESASDDAFLHDADERGDHVEFQSLVSGVLNDDSTLVQIVVQVEDINDNAPEFVNKIFTGGVTTAADFGTKIMSIKAIDRDDGINAKISYFQIGEIHRTLTEGLDQLSRPPFLVDRRTGGVILNFDPQKGMKGYFDFMVLANDTDGYQDSAHVFIYLLREDQRVRFVLRQQPVQVRDQIQLFRETLSNVTDAIVNVDDFKVHENKDGSVDKTKTDLYMHLVDRKDNSIFEVDEVLRLIDQNIEKLDYLFKEFNVLDTQPSEALLLTSDVVQGHIVLWLVFANIFVSTLLVVVISLCFSQRKTYKRELRAAYVNSYGSSPSDLTTRSATPRVPNTNKHSIEGSNPIWLKAYANEWFKNDDDLSHPGVLNGPDSLDENVLTAEYLTRPSGKEFNGFTTQNNLSPFNVYQQIDKLTNDAQLLTRKLETTEL